MVRWLTSCVVLITCFSAGFTGINITRFISYSAEEKPNTVQPWIGTPGLTTRALSNSLYNTTMHPNSDTPSWRAATLSELLSVRPLSAADWLSLAGIEIVAGNRRAPALAALELSSVAGPNEGGTMWERGAFGLLLWEALPETARTRTTLDLAGPIRDGLVGDREVAPIRSILSTKPAEVRSQIAARLASEGVSESALVRIGL